MNKSEIKHLTEDEKYQYFLSKVGPKMKIRLLWRKSVCKNKNQPQKDNKPQ